MADFRTSARSAPIGHCATVERGWAKVYNCLFQWPIEALIEPATMLSVTTHTNTPLTYR
jgi:hypothetical protein